MEDRFKNKYRIPSTRLAGWDYGSHGLYYITICTKDRVNYFGEVVSEQDADKRNTEAQNIASLRYTPIGEIAYKNWLDIPNHFSFIELDDFVIMPNHIHGILFINKPDKIDWQFNKFGVQSQNLASVIGVIKYRLKPIQPSTTLNLAGSPVIMTM